MDNPYCYPGTNTLINKLGIVDATELKAAEEFLTSKRMAQIDETPIRGDLDYKHLTEIHKHIFSDLYDWAGKQREWQTERASGRFQWPDNIEKEANKLLAALKNENHLKDLDRNNFIIRVAHYFGELNHIHPFPDGNGRSQRTFFNDLGRKAGYKFEWSTNKKGRDVFLEAVGHSHSNDTSKLESHFNKIVSFINKPSIGIAEKEAEYKSVRDAQVIVKETAETELESLLKPLKAQEYKLVENIRSLNNKLDTHRNSKPRFHSKGKHGDITSDLKEQIAAAKQVLVKFRKDKPGIERGLRAQSKVYARMKNPKEAKKVDDWKKHESAQRATKTISNDRGRGR